MSDWLTDPQPCSETVTVKQVEDTTAFGSADPYLTVVTADDTATAVVQGSARLYSEEWVIRVLSAYDLVLDLREQRPERRGGIIKFFPATGG